MSSDARALLAKYGFSAKKSWGQNFLISEAAYAAIVSATAATSADWVLEIGAGLGTLTLRLCQEAGHVIAIERDRDMAHVLRSELSQLPNFELAEANALTYDFPAAAVRAQKSVIVVGNLPYQIASPLIFRLLSARSSIVRAICMVQLEMAERICAQPGPKSYGALSVLCQAFARTRLVTKVKAGGFLPPPKVDSAVVLLEPYIGIGPAGDIGDEQWFRATVHAAFRFRRKTVRNALKSGFGKDSSAEPHLSDAALDRAFSTAAIDPIRRGETLAIAEFGALSRAIALEAAGEQVVPPPSLTRSEPLQTPETLSDSVQDA